jgi:peptide chain release factor subunit 1
MSEVSPLREALDRLAAFEPVGLPVISLYLDARPGPTGRDGFDSFLRKELTARGRSFPLRSAERESFEKDAARIDDYVKEHLEPSSNGLVLFACAGHDGFFEALQLDAPITENRLYVADRPHLYPLARLADQFPLYAVLLADTNMARLFVFGQAATLRTEEVSGDKVSRASVGGWSQMRYQRRIGNFHEQHAKEVVDVLERVVREEGVEQIVLAGDEVIVPVLREHMSQELNGRVIDVLRLDITTPEHEVLKATAEALREHDAETDVQQVEQMLNQYRAGQLAVAGVEGTLAALELGQVDRLLVSASPDQLPDAVKAVTSETGAVLDGNSDVPTAERLIQLARQTGADITFIEDPALLADVDGVGALLRYRL